MSRSIHTVEYQILLSTIRSCREKSCMSQLDLAERVGETQSFISKCERGERRLDIIEVRRICAGLGIPLQNFVAELEEKLGLEYLDIPKK